jgi:hypothetical protein
LGLRARVAAGRRGAHVSFAAQALDASRRRIRRSGAWLIRLQRRLLGLHRLALLSIALRPRRSALLIEILAARFMLLWLRRRGRYLTMVLQRLALQVLLPLVQINRLAIFTDVSATLVIVPHLLIRTLIVLALVHPTVPSNMLLALVEVLALSQLLALVHGLIGIL